VDVYRRDPGTGNAVGPATPVGVQESVTVKASVLPARPQTISVEGARELSNDFTAPVRAISPGTVSVSDEVTRAKDLVSVLNQPSGRTRDDAPSGTGRANGDKADKNGSNGGNGNSTAAVSGGAPSAAPAALPAAAGLPTTSSISSPGGNSANGQGRASDYALKNHPFKK
jgi:hypothetical protein